MNILGVALFLFGIAFFVFGLSCLGKGPLKEAAVILTLVGIINAILSIYLVVKVDPVAGGLALTFSLAWLVAGWNNLKGYGLLPFGNMAIFSAVWVALYSVSFWSQGAVTFGICTVLWVWAFVSAALLAYGKTSVKVVAWTYIIEAFVTLLYPAWCLVFGVPFILG